MRRIIPTIAAISAALILAPVAPAYADVDPQIPNPGAGYCPGGGQGSMIILGYCDGVKYPDGSYWHYIQYGVPLIGHPGGLLSPGMQCVIDNGSPVPAPAPAGGCGGTA
jgi:hypothetical protein